MKFLAAMALVCAASLAGGWGFPWWWPCVPGFFAGAWPGRSAGNGRTAPVLASFAGGALAWGGVAWFLDAGNGGILSSRIAPLFYLPGSFPLILATALVGGITAGLGAWAGRNAGAWRDVR
jgi:hypothetical protein